MNNKEIFELAEKCGEWDDFGRWTFRTDDRLLKFVMGIQKAEREACAVLCETECAQNDGITCAEEIRQRGEK
jgi:hypothetical protein